MPGLSLTLALFLAPTASRASELAGLLPGNAVMFAEIRSVPKLAKAKDQALVSSLNEAGFGKLIASLPIFADPLAADKFRTETGYFPSELVSRFPGGVATGIFEKPTGDQTAAASGGGESSATVVTTTGNTPDAGTGTGSASGEAAATRSGDAKSGADESAALDQGGMLVVADFSGDEALLEKIFSALAKAKTAPAAASTAKPVKTRLPEGVWPGDFAEKISYIEGVKVHQWNLLAPTLNRGKSMGWAFAGGKAFLSLGDGVLEESVRRQVKKITTEGLSTTTMYQEVEAAAGTWDLLAGMDLVGGMHFGRSAAQRVLKEAGKAGGFNQPSLNPLAQVGLKNLRYAFLSVDIQQQMIDVLAGTTYAAKPGLLGVYAAKGPGAEPLFAPYSARQVAWGTMDWAKGVGSLKQVIATLTPGHDEPQVDLYLAMLFGMTGVDVERDLFGRMGEKWWVMSRPDEAGGNSNSVPVVNRGGAPVAAANQSRGSRVIGISLKDRAGFQASLHKFIAALSVKTPLFNERQRQGTTIHELINAPAGCAISWVVKNDTLLISIGPAALLEDVLTGMARRPTATPLDQTAVKAAFSRMPEGHSAAGFATMESLAISGLTILRDLVGASPSVGGDGVQREPVRIPIGVSLPYFAASRLYLSDTSARIRLRLAPNY